MRWTMVIGAVITAALVLFSAATTPKFFESGTLSWIGVAAAMSIVLAYGAAGYFVIPVLSRGPSEILRAAAPAGFAAGGVYAAEIALEYALRPADNTRWGLAEFGAVFVLMGLSGFSLALRTGRLRPALAAGVWTGLIGALIWYAVLLSVTYLFRGEPMQAAVFRAEGDYEDFARSGMSNFNVFVMQDLLGAGVYHLLLSPLFGLLLGAFGALPGLFAHRFRARSVL